MRSALVILAILSLPAFAQSEGSADLSSTGRDEWNRNSDTFTKSTREKDKSLVNDLLGENPKSNSETKSLPQSDTSK